MRRPVRIVSSKVNIAAPQAATIRYPATAWERFPQASVCSKPLLKDAESCGAHASPHTIGDSREGSTALIEGLPNGDGRYAACS